MSTLAELFAELSRLLSAASEREQIGGWWSRGESAEISATVTLERGAHFLAPDGSVVELNPGNYQVEVVAEGIFRVASLQERRQWTIAASRSWHEFKLTSPLTLSVPTEDDKQNIVVLFPGGGALLASGSHRKESVQGEGPRALPTPVIFDAILRNPWGKPVGVKVVGWPASKFRFRGILLRDQMVRDYGTIDPGPSPSHFDVQFTPPNWVSATVLTFYGSLPIWSPGDSLPRGPSPPEFVTSVTPVTVTTSLSIVGRITQLLVTSLVMQVGPSVGSAAVYSSTWMDVYQVVPPKSGPVTFPEVIVATGFAGTGVSLSAAAASAEAIFTSATPGTGAQVDFELRVDGITIATRSCKFTARVNDPAGAILYC